jgi:hypothetical protein
MVKPTAPQIDLKWEFLHYYNQRPVRYNFLVIGTFFSMYEPYIIHNLKNRSYCVQFHCSYNQQTLISVNTSGIRYSICIPKNNTDLSKQVYEQFEEKTHIFRKFTKKHKLKFIYLTLV